MKDTIKNLHEQIDAQEKEKYMYYHLVKSDDDVVGMIAYSKYKSAKIEYIVSVKKRTGKNLRMPILKIFNKVKQVQIQSRDIN